MKHSIIEKLILIAVFLLLGYTLLYGIQNSYAILYNLLGFLYMTGIFYVVGVQWVGNPERIRNKSFYLKSAAGLLISGWFVLTLSYALYVGHLADKPIVWWSLFHPNYVKEFFQWFLAGTLTGTIYGVIRNQKLKGNLSFKLVAKAAGLLLCATGLIVAMVHFWSITYSGSDEILFIDKDQKLTSLNEVLSQPQIVGKTVYIDLWFSSCAPCIASFSNMGPGKELLKQNNIVMLYLGREISLPDSKIRWINTIKEYNLKGYHAYMSEELELDVIEQLKSNTGLHLGYPHYLLADGNGRIVDWNAPGITDTTGLKELIRLNKTANETAKRP